MTAEARLTIRAIAMVVAIVVLHWAIWPLPFGRWIASLAAVWVLIGKTPRSAP